LPAYKNTFRWKNASTDIPPDNGKKILISFMGVNYHGKFVAAENGFEVQLGSQLTILRVGESLIYWTEDEAGQ
jgi:hypothetical protein